MNNVFKLFINRLFTFTAAEHSLTQRVKEFVQHDNTVSCDLTCERGADEDSDHVALRPSSQDDVGTILHRLVFLLFCEMLVPSAAPQSSPLRLSSTTTSFPPELLRSLKHWISFLCFSSHLIAFKDDF